MRTGKVTLGVLVLALGVGVVLGCSSSIESSAPSGVSGGATERVGSVGLRLQPVAGITVTNVHYTVTQGSPTATPAPAIVAEGNLPTPGFASSLSFGVPLPVGSGYYIFLSGVSAELNDDVTCTGSYGPFAVAPNESASLNLQLTCVDNTKGRAVGSIDVKTDACPRLILDYAVAEPAVIDVGRSLQLFASAHDLDNAAEPITYAWSIIDPFQAGAATFSPANAANTTLLCKANSTAMTIQVTARNHQCQKSLQTVVACVDYTCGDGVVDPAVGETCDWQAGPGHSADPTCPSDCNKICGDGNVEGDETCDPLPTNPVLCYPPGDVHECHLRVTQCGDGFVTGTEMCDPVGNIGPNQLPLANGQICPSNCMGFIDPVCGDGIKAGLEECDDGVGRSSAPGVATSRLCSSSCESISTPACVECEQAGDCFASSDNCLGIGRPFTLAEQKTCTDVMQCIQDSNCLDGTGSLGKCYCGTLNTAACGAAPYDLTQPGAPNGPCAAIMQLGNPGLSSNSSILGTLTGKGRPTGAAGQRLNCEKADPLCAPLCGLE
jgi:hypothetical protein